MNINIPDFHKFKAKEKLERIKILFLGITSIVKKNSGILIPTYKMITFSIFRLSILLVGIILLIEKTYTFLAVVLILLFFLLSFWKYFFFVKQKALQSMLVYHTATKGESTLREVRTEYKKISRKMFLVGLADYFVEKSQNSTKKGIIEKLLLSALDEVWDLLKNFMIPVIAVEQKSIEEAAKDLKLLKSRAPEVLVGVLGIDFVGKFLVGALFPLFFVIFVLSIGLSWLLPFAFANVTQVTLSNFSFALVGVVLGFYVISVIISLIYIVAVSVKTIYFTILYTMIKYPQRINESIAPKLIQFIEMKN